jgi:methionine-rich copper-binding protein CopC
MKHPHRSSLLQDVGRAVLMMVIAVTLVLTTRVARAHAVLVQSSPAAGASLQGPDVPISLKFNSRVDGARSTVLLIAPDGKSTKLALDSQGSPDTLTMRASGLSAGKYALHWQVLAVDGHITRGQIPFEVK